MEGLTEMGGIAGGLAVIVGLAWLILFGRKPQRVDQRPPSSKPDTKPLEEAAEVLLDLSNKADEKRESEVEEATGAVADTDSLAEMANRRRRRDS